MVTNFADACCSMFAGQNSEYWGKSAKMNGSLALDIQKCVAEAYKDMMSIVSLVPVQLSSDYSHFLSSLADSANNPTELMGKVHEFYLSSGQKVLSSHNEMYGVLMNSFHKITEAVKEGVASGCCNHTSSCNNNASAA